MKGTSPDNYLSIICYIIIFFNCMKGHTSDAQLFTDPAEFVFFCSTGTTAIIKASKEKR